MPSFQKPIEQKGLGCSSKQLDFNCKDFRGQCLHFLKISAKCHTIFFLVFLLLLGISFLGIISLSSITLFWYRISIFRWDQNWTGRVHFMWIVCLTITNTNATKQWRNYWFNLCCERGYRLKRKEKQETHIHPSTTQLSHPHFLTPENDEDIIIHRKYFGAVTPPDQPNFLSEENNMIKWRGFFPFGNYIINPSVTKIISCNEPCVPGGHSNKNGTNLARNRILLNMSWYPFLGCSLPENKISK